MLPVAMRQPPACRRVGCPVASRDPLCGLFRERCPVVGRSPWCCAASGLGCLSSPVSVQGLSLVLSEGSLRDGEDREQPPEEELGGADVLQGYQWLLRDLPRLPLFDSVRTTTALALQQVGIPRPGTEQGRD